MKNIDNVSFNTATAEKLQINIVFCYHDDETFQAFHI